MIELDTRERFSAAVRAPDQRIDRWQIITFTPPASAMLQSPLSKLFAAWLTATRELLLAVSIATLVDRLGTLSGERMRDICAALGVATDCS